MPDTSMGGDLPKLEESAEIARDAIRSLLAVPLPKSIVVDGRSIEVSGTVADTRAQVTLTWPRGSARFRVGLATGSVVRRRVDDHGHNESFQVWSDDGTREMAFTAIEWSIRDAIRDSLSEVEVTLGIAFFERAAEEETGVGNAELGRRARELCARSGLTGTARVSIGTYDLLTRAWRPDATTAFGRVLALALIKTALRDRERGKLIRGEAPFPMRSATSSLGHLPALSSGERHGGVHLWFGGGAEQVDGLREALRFIDTESPTTNELGEWIRAEGQVSHPRLDVYWRLLLQLGVASRDAHGRWAISELGAAVLESDSADALYRAFVANYVGFEETLAFFARHPEGELTELLVDLNQCPAPAEPRLPKRRLTYRQGVSDDQEASSPIT